MKGTIAIALAAAMLLHCAASDDAPSQCYPACSEEERCEIDPRCRTEGICAPTCTGSCAQLRCDEGHDCRSVHGIDVCLLECESQFCENGRLCSGPRGSCVDVGCTSDASCDASKQYCESKSHTCYALDGACSDKAPCPALPDNYRAKLMTTCDAGKCVVQIKPIPPVADSSASATLRPIFPEDRQLSATDVRLRWEPVADPILVFVSRSAPTLLSEVSRLAFWASSATAGKTQALWADGVDVTNGTWGSGPPKPPPVGEPLYLTLATLRSGELRAISTPTLFVIGEWKPDGATCTDEGSVAGQCATIAPRACIGGSCARLCTSHEQCVGGLLCGHPVAPTGLRVCGAP